MNFLLIASFPESILTFRGPLIDALIDHGLKLHIASPDLPTGCEIRKFLESKCLTVHNIPLCRTGMNPLSDVVLFFHLWLLIRRIQPNVVMGYTIKPVIYGSLTARLAGVPKIFSLITGLGYAFTERGGGGALSYLVRRLYRLGLSYVQMVFFQNPDDETLFRQLGIIRAQAMTKIVNGSGIDITKFRPSPLPEKVKFLLIARLLGNKGVREYAEAARKLHQRYPDVIFRLVGWIDDNPDAIRQDELDGWLADQTLEYLGRLKDVRPALANSSVYVLPSYREGTPRSVLEAMAMGRAIITTDAPGCRETVIDGENGFLVPVKSVDALVVAMQKFIDNPTIAQTMGKRSREIAVQKYDVHEVNKTMIRAMGLA